MSIKVVKLGDVCEVIAGQSPPSSTYNNKQFGIPFFQGKADFGEHYPSVRFWCNKPKKIAEPNDILLSVRAPVGPTNICNLQSCIGRGLAAIRSNGKTHFKYVYYFFKFIESKLANTGNGSTFTAITVADVKNIAIPIPPFSTQQKIASILDKADELRRKDKELLTKYEELLQSIFYQMFGDPVKNKKGWAKVKLSSVCNFSQGIQIPIEEQFYIQEDGYLRFLRISDYTTKTEERFVDIMDKKYKVDIDDIVIVRYGASAGFVGIGKSGILANNLFKLNHDRNILSSKFLYYFLKTNYYTSFIQKVAFGAAMPALSFSVLDSFEIFLPQMELQKKFELIVREGETLKQQMMRTSASSEELFQSFLQKAFKGELIK